jgi:Leucine-rich repeat (LRR) protein
VSEGVGAVWNFSVDLSGQYLYNPCGAVSEWQSEGVSEGVSGKGWQGVQCSAGCFNTSSNVNVSSSSVSSSSLCSVEALVLDEFGLAGSLSPALSSLQSLESLDLRSNPALSGSIPSFFGNLTSLTSLQLQSCGLTGNLPSSLQYLLRLEVFDVDSNSLDGSIPSEFGKLVALSSLQLHSNLFTGSIPDSMGTLYNLTLLYLHNNHLTSSIPSSLGELTELSYLILYNNLLTGIIPPSLGNLVKLNYFYVNDNVMTGTIPSSLGNLSEVVYFWIHTNHFSGTIPPELGKLSKMYYFAAQSNAIQGTLSTDLSSLTTLRYMYLYRNSLSGSIPQEVAGMRSLYYLYLHVNQLTGTIPPAIRLLNKLRGLRLFSNKLTGFLPSYFPPLLDYLDIDNNNLNGTLPEELGSLSRLEVIFCDHNSFTGTLPLSWSKLSRLQYLYLDSNKLNGTFPEEYGRLTSLEYISIAHNILIGSIPNSVSNLTSLLYMDFSVNLFSSTIPKDLQYLKKLNHLWLNNNYFTGHVPIEIFSLQNMVVMWLHVNQLSGVIPSKVGQLPIVQSFSLSANHITGTIPSALGQAHSMSALMLDNNYLTSSIPFEIGNMTNMQSLLLHENFLTNSIPRSIGNLVQLRIMEIAINYFSSALPQELGKLTNLVDLFISENSFTGSLDSLLSQPANSSLMFIEGNDNRFSGQLSDSLFDLPQLTNLILSSNCFGGSVPANICALRSVKVLALDGLGASAHCRNSVTMPFSGVRLFNSLDGSVPSCLFALPNLTSLHMMGNSLTGTLSADIPHNSSLERLVLSHNRISGTIPESIQQNSFVILDLSYNKLTGVFEDHDVNFNQSNLILEVNRLSGNLRSSALGLVSYLEILQGNMFGCGHNPTNDEYYREYSCGSSQLDDSIYLWGVLTGCVVIYLAFTTKSKWGQWCFCGDNATSLNSMSDNITEARSYCKPLMALKHAILFVLYPLSLPQHMCCEEITLFRIIEFCKNLYSTLRVGIMFSLASLLFFVPFYALKLLDWGEEVTAYATHSNMYGFTASVAYMSGEAPAVLLLLGWGMLLTLYAALYVWLKYFTKISELESVDESKASKFLKIYDGFVLMGVLGANSAIVGAVNGLYLYSIYEDLTSDSRVLIQVLVSFFSVLFNLMCVPVLASVIKVPAQNCRARLLMMILNNIFIPCTVAACASPSCFKVQYCVLYLHLLLIIVDVVIIIMQGVFVEEDSTSPRYILSRCQNYDVELTTNTFTCSGNSNFVFIGPPVVPPFAYMYQCSSFLLSAYIPVFIYVSAIEILVVLGLMLCLFLRNDSVIWWLSRAAKLGVLWPEFWSTASKSNAVSLSGDHVAAAELLLNPIKIATNDIVLHCLVQLTFGLTSPVLTIAVMVSFCLKLSMWMMLIGRFLFYRINAVNSAPKDIEVAAERCTKPKSTVDNIAGARKLKIRNDHALVALGQAQLSIRSVYVSCFWPIAVSSSFFIAVLVWDMAADRVDDARSALWAPLSALGMPIFLWLIERGLVVWRNYELQKTTLQCRITTHLGDKAVEIVSTSFNPLSAVSPSSPN